MAFEQTEKTYSRTVLHENDSFEVVSIAWQKGSHSPEHNHGWSECCVLIEDGVFENELNMGINRETQILEKGQVLSTPMGAKHGLRCLSETGRTLHVYTPKINEHTDAGRFASSLSRGLKESLTLNEPTRIDRLREILGQIRAESISTRSPYFMNQLFAGVLPQMLLADELISQTKTTLATFEASPVFSTIESQVVEALGEIIGWPAGHREGVSAPGGSAANFMAVHCARQKLLPKTKTAGLSGEKLKIYVSTEAHYSFKKACAVLGLGTDSVVPVPVDDHGRMAPNQLQSLIDLDRARGATPLMIVATVGTTVLGAFDPIDELAAVGARNQVWLHVDGAWGGPALFSPKIRHLMNGVEKADSVTFDAHKLFGASLPSSFFLTSHKGLLLEANDVSGGDYLFHSDDPQLDRGKLSWQCGRNAEATSFWAIWKSVGTAGLGQFVDRLLTVRDQIVEWVATQPRLQLVADPAYLNVCVRVLPPKPGLAHADWSKTVRETLKEKNLAMVNYSANDNGTFLRLILAHPDLEFKHVRQILEWGLAVGCDSE